MNAHRPSCQLLSNSLPGPLQQTALLYLEEKLETMHMIPLLIDFFQKDGQFGIGAAAAPGPPRPALPPPRPTSLMRHAPENMYFDCIVFRLLTMISLQ